MFTKLVNVKNEKYDVSIMRKNGKIPDPPNEGCLGNPFFLKDINDEKERKLVVDRYRIYFNNRIKEKEFREYVESLKGKILGCVCAPKLCHGNIIVEWLNSY